MNLRRIPPLPWPKYDLLGPDERAIGGDAPKHFLTVPGTPLDGHAYIAKSPRAHGARECVTEAMISSIGRHLPVKLARFRLHRLGPPMPERADVRFMSRFFLGDGEVLYHGDELVSWWLDVPEVEVREVLAPDKRAERSLYSIDFICEILRDVFLADEYIAVRNGLGRMLAFDALVGAKDRHPRNWGVIAGAAGRKSSRVRFSPVFDTARGLFWNLSDDQLRKRVASLGRDGWIEKYARGSQPLISCNHRTAQHEINHFDLVEYIMTELGALRSSVASVISAFSIREVERVLDREYSRLLSRFRLSLVADLLRYRSRRLKLLCTRTKTNV